MSRISALFAAACLCTLGTVGAAQAAMLGRAAAKHPTTHKHKKAVKKNGLAAPSLEAPANGAKVEQIPTLTWHAVGGAVEYEYQVASDSHFNSIVLGGSGRGKGSSTTYNLAATLSQAVPDNTFPSDPYYYWRVRALGKTKKPGPWSTTRALTKKWTAAPQLLGPANGTAIAWPSSPLVLSWTPVPDAGEYVVTIAADPALANIVLGSATSPQKTAASVFAFPSTLPEGRYYWAITPVDAEGHRGTPSAVASFNWSWPTATSTQLEDVNLTPQVFDPLFKWNSIPGAAKYEVEVNSAVNFPVGSKWCCENRTIGTSLAPTSNLGNNEYYWRVRAIDARGNAGQWNEGVGFPGAANPGGFVQAFDNPTPRPRCESEPPGCTTISHLSMTDVEGEPIAEEDPKTNTPIVTWSPVPGAASYEVQITPYLEGEGCNWAAEEPQHRQTFETASTSWTPLSTVRKTLNHSAWPHPRSLNFPIAEGDASWCVRVAARTDDDLRRNQVVSKWTQLPEPSKKCEEKTGVRSCPAFRFASQPAPGASKGLETIAEDYLSPHLGTSLSPGESACGLPTPCRDTPFFTWRRVPGADLYYIVIARDKSFTNVVDIATTNVPAYAPVLGEEEPLNDETTEYYWAVVPAKIINKGTNKEELVVLHEPPEEDAPQVFNKSSAPPTLLPVTEPGKPPFVVENQPTFHWRPAEPAEGALNYTLQVSADPSFGKENLLDEVITDSNAYTSSSTYPANTTLYWRVRANDANFHREGLNWAPVQTFTRTLPKPQPASGNPTGGAALPALSWTPVSGAIAYDVHVDEANGGTKDFTVDSTAFTPTEWFGTGKWLWKVRPEFPSGNYQTVPGGYFGAQAFERALVPPSGATGIKAGSRIVISWAPDPYAKEYRVEIATTESFSTTVDSDRVDGLSWAPPNVDLTNASNKGTLYWRVAGIDQGDNTGPFTTGKFVAPKSKPKCTVKKVKRKGKTVKVCVASTHKKKK
jgi:hypothetical protein